MSIIKCKDEFMKTTFLMKTEYVANYFCSIASKHPCKRVNGGLGVLEGVC
jgi:hypothetical protein